MVALSAERTHGTLPQTFRPHLFQKVTKGVQLGISQDRLLFLRNRKPEEQTPAFGSRGDVVPWACRGEHASEQWAGVSFRGPNQGAAYLFLSEGL